MRRGKSAALARRSHADEAAAARRVGASFARCDRLACAVERRHGEPLCIIGVEDFIAMKLFAHGPQELADTRSALDAAGDNLDLPLLRRLAERFGQEAARALEAALRAR